VRMRLCGISVVAAALTGFPVVNVHKNGVLVGAFAVTTTATAFAILDASGKPFTFVVGDTLRVDIPSGTMTATNLAVAVFIETYGA